MSSLQGKICCNSEECDTQILNWCLFCWGRVFFISWVGTSMIWNYLLYKNCCRSSSLVKSLLYDCIKESPCSASLLVTPKVFDNQFRRSKASYFRPEFWILMEKIGIKSKDFKNFFVLRVKKFWRCLPFRKLSGCWGLFREFFHHLHAIAWLPCAALFQTKQHHQKRQSNKISSKECRCWDIFWNVTKKTDSLESWRRDFSKAKFWPGASIV